MGSSLIKLCKKRINRAMRVRKRMHGTALKPRLTVNKSNSHIQAQLIDDDAGVTLYGTSTYAKAFKATEFNKKSKASAAALGAHIAEIAQKQNIKEVVFDRGPFKYCGVLAALADAARNGGLQF